MWRIKTGELLETLGGDIAEPITAVAFSPNGKLIVSGEENGTISLWNVEKRKIVKTLKKHKYWINNLNFSPCGKMLASGSEENICLWDVQTGKLLKTLEGHFDQITSLDFSPNGKMLVSGSWDNTVRLWNVKKGRLIQTLEGHLGVVTSVVFHTNNKIIASCNGDNLIFIWNRKGVVKILKNPSSDVYSLAFSSDGRILASGNFNGTITLWDVKSWQVMKILKGHKNRIVDVTFSNDNSILRTIDEVNNVLYWDIKNGNSLEEHIIPTNMSFLSPRDYKNIRIYPLSENIILEFPLDSNALPENIKKFLMSLLSCDNAWVPYSNNSYIPLKNAPEDILELLKSILSSTSKD